MKAMPHISVIIPTFNRADLLDLALESLENQSLSSDRFEVVVIDDGSSDSTGEVCKTRQERLGLRYFRQVNSGSSVAKNLGIFVSDAPIIFFFDDDDVADAKMLEEHLKGHRKYDSETVAILGFTTWHPRFTVTPVMDYLVNIGQFLFSYPNLEREQELDFSYFWTGRISCKRRFLTHNGVFSQKMKRVEDVELGFRLAQHGLKVRYWPDAVSYMNRPVTFDDFCDRAAKDGRSLNVFRNLHPDPRVQHYCHKDAVDKWRAMEPDLPGTVKRVKEIENQIGESSGEAQQDLLETLWKLYREAFISFAVKGVAEAARKTTTGNLVDEATMLN
ncbi:MAG: glycosyltransferase [Thermoanaerobaculales bacterium]|nr:glycosyltransferase [Thermoanaerobaculales bacterium]